MLMQKGTKHGARWTPEEDAELKRRCDDGDYLGDIAKGFGRSQESVRTRANVLGIPCRSRPSRARMESAGAG